MLSWTDILLRLCSALLIGGVIGVNRELHHKPTGMRTLGLVGLGSALAIIVVAEAPEADISRVIQGIITGIGFLGAGVILRGESVEDVRGLTTAATVWVTAAIGIACGLAAWRVVGVAFVLMLFLLTLGGRIEKWCLARLGLEDHSPDSPDSKDQSQSGSQ